MRAVLPMLLIVTAAGCATAGAPREPRASRSPGAEALSREAAVDVMIRLAATGPGGRATAASIYVAGVTLVDETGFDAEAFARSREESFAPPQWEWARAHSDDPELDALLDAAEARGVPARAVFAEFRRAGPAGRFGEEGAAPSFPLAPELSPPTREEKLAALLTLGREEAPAPAALHLIAQLLGAEDVDAIAERETITTEAIRDLRQELASLDSASGARLSRVDELLDFVRRELVCARWSLQQQHPDAARPPSPDRGCGERSAREPTTR